MGPEKKIETQIRKWLKMNGFYCWKNHGSQFTLSGMPDLMAVKDGRLFCIEVKATGKRATELQRSRLETLRGYGAIAFEADSLDIVADRLEDYV